MDEAEKGHNDERKGRKEGGMKGTQGKNERMK